MNRSLAHPFQVKPPQRVIRVRFLEQRFRAVGVGSVAPQDFEPSLLFLDRHSVPRLHRHVNRRRQRPSGGTVPSLNG